MKKKIIHIITIFNVVFAIMFTQTLSVFAHSLTPWAKLYTKQKAGGDFHFAIGDFHHPNGNAIKYYWDNATTKKNFSTAFSGGVKMWYGMISATESSSQDSHIKITYNPNIAANEAAYVVIYLPSGHYEPGGQTTTMVIGNITKYTASDKTKVLGHEIGHVWGMSDLYDVKPNLASIYARPYTYPMATQGDINGMYICLNTPWYYQSGPDRRAKYQKAPGVWAKSETLVIAGKTCKFDASGYLISSK